MIMKQGTDMVHVIGSSEWKGIENFAGMLNPIAERLAKSTLVAGTGVDAATFTGGRALTYESLDSQLQSITLTEEDARFWRLLPKRPIHATVDQFNRLSKLGSRWGTAVGEIQDPARQVGDIARVFEEVSYYREQRAVSDVGMLVNMIVDPYDEQVREGLLNIVHNLDMDLFWSLRAAVPTKVNGIFAKLIGDADVVHVDMGGKYLTSRDTLIQAVAKVRNKGGRITHCLPNPLLVEDFAIIYETAERLFISTDGKGKVYGGGNFGGFHTSVGTVEFDADPFNWVGWEYPTAAEGHDGRPANPPQGVAAAAAGTGGNIPTGTYHYRVSAVNAFGETTTVTDNTAVVAGEKVTLTITRPTTADATGYFIYRSAKDGTADACRMLWMVADSGGATTTFVDDGTWVPGTCHVPLLDLRPQANTMQWSQLLPASRKPLAPIGAYEWFLINLYGAFRLTKPTWNSLVRNVLPRAVLAEGWDPLGLYP